MMDAITKQKFDELRSRMGEIQTLSSVSAVLGWDQAAFMPPRGARARGRQIALVERLAHAKLTDPDLGRLLDELESVAEGLPHGSFEAALVRATRRKVDRATRIPADFLAEYHEHVAQSYQVWTEARPANDFGRVRPYLERTLDLSRRMAGFFPGYEHIADPLIDFADHGMKASSIRALFDELRAQLVPIVQAITEQAPADDSCLHQHFPAEEQLAFAREVIRDFGFDFTRGRQDRSPHPFMTSFSLDDVRITTRVDEKNLGGGLFSMLHECGHALYELGIDPALEGTPLAEGTSSGVHESQSRLWENLVGRSRGFWEHYYPRLQRAFPGQLGSVPLDTFYRAVNKVKRSLIRVDADEVTYNLHVIIRFELELELLDGKLSIADLPEVWRARYASDLGVPPPDDRDGVLQDVHWYGMTIGGAFQGYTLGNLLSAQLFDGVVRDRPSVPDEIRAGEFKTLHDWLGEKVYRHGAAYTAPELIERVTGGPLRVEPYIGYLRSKFGGLYEL